MGKTQTKNKKNEDGSAKAAKKSSSKKKLAYAILTISATYNNTLMSLTDEKGQVITWSSSGSMGFKGAKKGTPFAAAKVSEFLADKAIEMGVKEVSVVIKGVGSGRESAIRSFVSKGISLKEIKDVTGVPFNGPKPKKPRRI